MAKMGPFQYSESATPTGVLLARFWGTANPANPTPKPVTAKAAANCLRNIAMLFPFNHV
jgi:hypothetical protein